MEGWIIGKTKVFLKYYNEEYLSRLYETQVRKIVKVQCMMRAFLARKNIVSKMSIKKKIGKYVNSSLREFVHSKCNLSIILMNVYIYVLNISINGTVYHFRKETINQEKRFDLGRWSGSDDTERWLRKYLIN